MMSLTCSNTFPWSKSFPELSPNSLAWPSRHFLIWFLTVITFLQAVFQGSWAFCNLPKREIFPDLSPYTWNILPFFSSRWASICPWTWPNHRFLCKTFLAFSSSHHNPLQAISQLIFPCDYIIILRKNNLLRWNSLNLKLAILKWINSVTFSTFTRLCKHYLHGVPNGYNF